MPDDETPANPIYPVVIGREKSLWTAVTGGLPPGIIAAADFEKIENIIPHMRGIIASVLDVDLHSFEMDVQFVFSGEDVSHLISAYAEAELRLESATFVRNFARKELVQKLDKLGVSDRAIGALTKLSHQRIHQIRTEG